MYHKGRNITGQNKPRMTFLPEAHSVLWHYWNSQIRPVAVFFLQVLGLVDRAKEMATWVWVSSRKGVLDTEDFSNILKRRFHEGGVEPLGVREWRQASVAIVDAHIKIDHSVGENTMFEKQQGHSRNTANMRYAGCGGYDIDCDSETKFRLVSHAMHRFWNIDSVRTTEFVPLVLEDQLTGAELAKKALKLYTEDEDAEFRTTFQARWVKGVFDRREDYLIVACTGGGKSLAYTLPPLVETSGTTVIIQPLCALVSETALELERMKVDHIVYQPGMEIDDWNRVVVCTTEAASTPAFRHQLKKLAKINRFIIDEAHCYLDDIGFRAYATGVAKLRCFNAPFILMTATLQPDHEQTLLNLFSIQNYVPEREITARKELQFVIHPVTRDLDFITDQVALNVTESSLVNRDRSIIFIENISKCELVMARLEDKGIPVTIYNSKLTSESQKEQAALWRSTPKCVMVATSGFGAGINFKHVRHVFLIGMPRDDEVNKSFQEAGRAGRDEAPATVWLFPTSKPAKGSFAHKLMDKTLCIPGVYAKLLDGKHLKCYTFDAFNPCTHCDGQHFSEHDNLPSEPPSGEPLPGAMVEYSSNVKKSWDHQARVKDLALAISKVRKSLKKTCGWCLAKNIQEKHPPHRCPQLANKNCCRCSESGHTIYTCKRSLLSNVMEKNGTHDLFMCPRCGLAKQYKTEPFHINGYDKATQKCDSGLQDVCQWYVWYHWRYKKQQIEDVIACLTFNVKKVPTTISTKEATTEQFIQWQGSNGFLGCPWANVVTLFLLLSKPDLKKWL
ncbi:uncharacterized protein MELLADRAFT_62517 [Melampsora larici-populina 98AG31]|uniref:DNA 3'-5' helicase n=1 Tax=Melampsora larici-populina (strain 98AG31 / pathotype 3-4-7) TaxID=747676 RepID=F4RJ76_MELLP|nr:uncharacterized protein MELLADRAFT_62517 [Melampsora larici-populina 98AG31]EGG07552.1 hypothetical protein MELLADRAFT_62517 [Melampsora larici-populina 98AG31]